MKRRVTIAALALAGFALCLLTSSSCAQGAMPPAYSNQAAVVQDVRTTIIFHRDGTSTATADARMKVQSQAGVQALGILRFPYASATTRIRVVYVRVVKPDKRVVVTPADNILNLPAPITRQAPFYSDIKELQVAVKGLQIGDTLEFETRTHVVKPLDPGQFWINVNFTRSAIVLHQTLQISVPRHRKVTVKSATVQPTVSDKGAYRVYTWQTKNLKVKSAKDKANGNSRPVDVQVTTFQSWDQVGKWFGGLVASRAVPTAAIRAKADELTQGAQTKTQQIRDLYTFVSEQFRYIGIALGIGRYQPHFAANVLDNEYGDCKDKHTLLAALLAAKGIKAYPALISTGHKIDVDVPSPAQFDHVITAVPQKAGFLFLDTTSEVGPYGYLVSTLRDKKALVIPSAGPVQFVTTPASPPFPLFFHFQANATLDDSGTLTSKMQMTFRDDAELIYRLALRVAGQAQWNTVMQKISQSLGFGGTVTDVTATPPDQIQSPLHIEYDYKRKDYSDWSDKWISSPFPPFFLPAAPDDVSKGAKPVKLGSPEKTDYTASIKLPTGIIPKLPDGVHLSEPFADYDATYSMSGGVLHVEKRLVTKMRAVKPAELLAYRKFEKAIEKDEKINIYLGVRASTSTSGSPEAQKLFEQGREAWQLQDVPDAINYFQRATDKDPKYAQAWYSLGLMHAVAGSFDEAGAEFRRAIALNPHEAQFYEALSDLLMTQQRPDDALTVLKQLQKLSPGNTVAPLRIGEILLSLKRYSDAVPELQDALKRDPHNAALLARLGTAYAHSGAKDKAAEAFEQALGANPSNNNLNDIAYVMADQDLKPDKALQYAERAVAGEESITAKIDINHVEPEDLETAPALAAYWDTLGWAYFRTGHLKESQRYLMAGWHLSQDPLIADHLGQLYEKEGSKREAVRAYSQALATGHAPEDVQGRLDALRGYSKRNPITPVDLQNLRIVRVLVTSKPAKHADADFYVIISPGGKVVAKFLSGSRSLRGAGKALAAAKFETIFPDNGPVQVLRRGILDCEPELKECSFAMYPIKVLPPTEGASLSSGMASGVGATN